MAPGRDELAGRLVRDDVIAALQQSSLLTANELRNLFVADARAQWERIIEEAIDEFLEDRE